MGEGRSKGYIKNKHSHRAPARNLYLADSFGLEMSHTEEIITDHYSLRSTLFGLVILGCLPVNHICVSCKTTIYPHYLVSNYCSRIGRGFDGWSTDKELYLIRLLKSYHIITR